VVEFGLGDKAKLQRSRLQREMTLGQEYPVMPERIEGLLSGVYRLALGGVA
jgi:hypothetical protein